MSREEWEAGIIRRYGSLEAYKKWQSERAKKHGFQKGYVPHNKIFDEFTDLPVSRQRRHQLRQELNKPEEV